MGATKIVKDMLKKGGFISGYGIKFIMEVHGIFKMILVEMLIIVHHLILTTARIFLLIPGEQLILLMQVLPHRRKSLILVKKTQNGV